MLFLVTAMERDRTSGIRRINYSGKGHPLFHLAPSNVKNEISHDYEVRCDCLGSPVGHLRSVKRNETKSKDRVNHYAQCLRCLLNAIELRENRYRTPNIEVNISNSWSGIQIKHFRPVANT